MIRFGMKAATVAALAVLLACGSALGVGYERYEPASRVSTNAKSKAAGNGDLVESLKKASFWDKYPVVIDETVSFVKDVLSQFGIAGNKNR